MVMKSIRTRFIREAYLKQHIIEFLENKLRNVWVASVYILKSPIETRIYVEVLDPRRLLGKNNRKLRALEERIKNEFGVENPRIQVVEIANAWLEPKIVAKRIARSINMGRTVRGVLYRSLTNIINNNAIGAEIIAKGKLGGKGAKARTMKVYAGFVPKAGDPVKQVKYCHYPAVTKAGIIGITVRIAPPDIQLPDKNIKKEVNEVAAAKS